jgi:hypothetical protein
MNNTAKTILIVVGLAVIVFIGYEIFAAPSLHSNTTAENAPSPIPNTQPAGNQQAQSTTENPKTSNRNSNQAVQQPQNITLQISAKDYKTSAAYSTLTLSIPWNAFSSPTEVKVSAVPPTACGNLSGVYLLFPQGQKLSTPATVSITYTDAAVTLHKECYSDFTETNLTLAYYDNSTYKYVSLPSTFNPSTRTVSGNISQFYSGGITVVPTSLIH